jgi:hypothetical protein
LVSNFEERIEIGVENTVVVVVINPIGMHVMCGACELNMIFMEECSLKNQQE